RDRLPRRGPRPRRRPLRRPDAAREGELPHLRPAVPAPVHRGARHRQGRLRPRQPRPRPPRRRRRRGRRRRRRARPRRRPRRPLPPRRLPDRQRDLDEHERERGHRPPRRRGRRPEGPPQRRRQHGAVVERRDPDGDARRRAGRDGGGADPGARPARRGAGGEGGGVRRRAQERADAPHGRHARPPRAGVRRLSRAAGQGVRAASAELAELALGGTAVGTGINRHPGFPAKAIAYIAEMTGVSFREAEDHFEAQGAKDAYVSAAGALNTVAVSLMKIANDVRWMGSGPTSGLAEIRLPSLQPGSSLMPGKVNPVMSEALMMVCARVMGNAVTVTVGGQHGNFELNVMMPVMAHAMLESVTILANACDAFRARAVEGIEANRERCRELLEKNPAIATALNAEIGYDQAAKVAKRAAAEGRSVRDVLREMALVPEDRLDAVLDVRSMTEPGIPGRD